MDIRRYAGPGGARGARALPKATKVEIENLSPFLFSTSFFNLRKKEKQKPEHLKERKNNGESKNWR